MISRMTLKFKETTRHPLHRKKSAKRITPFVWQAALFIITALILISPKRLSAQVYLSNERNQELCKALGIEKSSCPRFFTQGQGSLATVHDEQARNSKAIKINNTEKQQATCLGLTLPSSMAVTYRWRISSHASDHFKVFHETGDSAVKKEKNTILGKTVYETHTEIISQASTKVLWCHQKNSEISNQEGASYLDSMEITPIQYVNSTTNQSICRITGVPKDSCPNFFTLQHFPWSFAREGVSRRLVIQSLEVTEKHQYSCMGFSLTSSSKLSYRFRFNSQNDDYNLHFFTGGVFFRDIHTKSYKKSRNISQKNSSNFTQLVPVSEHKDSETIAWCHQKSKEENSEAEVAYFERLSIEPLLFFGDYNSDVCSALGLSEFCPQFFFLGHAPWETVDHPEIPNEKAVKSGSITYNQESCFGFTLPSDFYQVNYDFHISSDQDTHQLSFFESHFANGMEMVKQQTLSEGGVTYNRENFIHENEGPYTAMWCYEKGRFGPAYGSASYLANMELISKQEQNQKICQVLGLLEDDFCPTFFFTRQAVWRIADDLTAEDGKAMKSSAIQDGEESCMGFHLPSSYELNFRWRISSQADFDKLTFSSNDTFIEGINHEKISGELPYENQKALVLSYEDNTRTVKWCYQKDQSLSSGEDSAYLDSLSLLSKAERTKDRTICRVLGISDQNFCPRFLDQGDAPWTIVEDLKAGNGKAIKSGLITHNQESCIAFKLNAPYQLKYRWRTSSQPDSDRLSFSSDSSVLSSINHQNLSGNRTYSHHLSVAFNETEGEERLVKWCYQKDQNLSHGEDAGYLDSLELTTLNNADEENQKICQALGLSSALCPTLFSIGSAPWKLVNYSQKDSATPHSPSKKTLKSGDIKRNQKSCMGFLLKQSAKLTYFPDVISQNTNPQQIPNQFGFFFGKTFSSDSRYHKAIPLNQDPDSWTQIVLLNEDQPHEVILWCYQKNNYFQQGEAVYLDALGIQPLTYFESQNSGLCSALGIPQDEVCPHFFWTGDRAWSVASDSRTDNDQALRSGAVYHNEESCIGFSLPFSHQLRYSSRVFSQENSDHLSFFENRSAVESEITKQNHVSGYTNYTNHLREAVSHGENRISLWCYQKDQSGSRGEDAGFLGHLHINPSLPDNLEYAQNQKFCRALGISEEEFCPHFSFKGPEWTIVEDSKAEDGKAMKSGSVEIGEESCMGFYSPLSFKMTYRHRVTSEPQSAYFYTQALSTDGQRQGLTQITGEQEYETHKEDRFFDKKHRTFQWCYRENRINMAAGKGVYLDSLDLKPIILVKIRERAVTDIKEGSRFQVLFNIFNPYPKRTTFQLTPYIFREDMDSFLPDIFSRLNILPAQCEIRPLSHEFKNIQMEIQEDDVPNPAFHFHLNVNETEQKPTTVTEHQFTVAPSSTPHIIFHAVDEKHYIPEGQSKEFEVQVIPYAVDPIVFDIILHENSELEQKQTHFDKMITIPAGDTSDTYTIKIHADNIHHPYERKAYFYFLPRSGFVQPAPDQ